LQARPCVIPSGGRIVNDEDLIALLIDPDRATLTIEEAGRELVETGPAVGHTSGTEPILAPAFLMR
jgi:hypothetical protein